MLVEGNRDHDTGNECAWLNVLRVLRVRDSWLVGRGIMRVPVLRDSADGFG
jgi:hypothetical protein